MVEKIVLHIGATKTGTSAIQSAMVQNRAALLAQGILVPESRREDKAEEGRVTGGNCRPIHKFSSKYAAAPNAAARELTQALDELFSESSARTVLFSSEALGAYDADVLASLKKVLSKYCDRFQIVYYVRHLADHANSQYSEKVKRRQFARSLHQYCRRYKAPFKTCVQTYEAVFGADAVNCVLYDDVRDRLWRHFLELIGADYEGVDEPLVVNRSLSVEEIDALRAINRLGHNRVLVAQAVEDFTFRVSHENPRSVPISKLSIEAIRKKNQDTIDFINERLSGYSPIGVASEKLLARVVDEKVKDDPTLDADVIFALLDSSLRVMDRRIADQRALKQAVREISAHLGKASDESGLLRVPGKAKAHLQKAIAKLEAASAAIGEGNGDSDDSDPDDEDFDEDRP